MNYQICSLVKLSSNCFLSCILYCQSIVFVQYDLSLDASCKCLQNVKNKPSISTLSIRSIQCLNSLIILLINGAINSHKAPFSLHLVISIIQLSSLRHSGIGYGCYFERKCQQQVRANLNLLMRRVGRNSNCYRLIQVLSRLIIEKICLLREQFSGW